VAPTPAAAVRLVRLLRGLRPDLLQGWMYHGNLAALMAAPLLPTDVPVLWNITATQCDLRQEKLTTALAIWLGARLSRRPDRILTDSMASARAHKQLRYETSGWVIVPNGFDLDRFRPSGRDRSEVLAELSLPADALLVGLIGRYHAVKDHAGFLEAAAGLWRSAPEARFLVVGRGVDANPALIEKAAALGLSGVVRFLGERADIPRLAAALDIAVSSSYSESFPNVVGEAMCCGIPCVVTDVGDSAYLVGETGLVVPPRDPAALASACGDLARRGAEGRRALGFAARERIVRLFSAGSMAARYGEIYGQALKSKRMGGSHQCAA
jgi:glycosyltransferase involved in cell wall biosynthesis